MQPTGRSFEEVKRIAPGAETVVQAGDVLVITDVNGQEIAVRGEECDEVMAVLQALDAYLAALASNVQGVVLDSLRASLRQAHAQLPRHVVRHLRASGVVKVPVL